MIGAVQMSRLADYQVAHARNKDWNRPVIKSGKMREMPVHSWNGKDYGMATLAYFKFKTVPEGHFLDASRRFKGFIIAALEVQGKTITEATPVIGSIEKDDWGRPLNHLASRFCPDCGAIDSVKQRSRVLGPECVLVTYFCKCGFGDTDVID